jgi:glycosyltransferase involved in cell wall biosynthesis
MKISVILPVYNEENTINQVINALLQKVENLLEIIVVDDGSTDSTGRISLKNQKENPIIHYILISENSGKTAALREGIKHSKGDIVIVQDADLEYDPQEINAVVEPIQTGVADVVLGSRFLVRKTSRSIYFRHYMANRFISFLSNLFTDLNLSDVETCYKAFRGEIIRNMIITSRRFGFEIEAIAKIAKLKCRVYEVPISYYGRSYEEGKKIGWVDGFMALVYVIKYNLLTSKKRSFRKNEVIEERLV